MIRPLTNAVPRTLARAALLVLLPGALAAQAGTRVHGRVLDAAGNPLARATVEVPGSFWSTLTGADGGFELRLPAGEVRIRASRIGYTPQVIVVTVGDVAASDSLVIRLAPDPVALRGISVAAPRAPRRGPSPCAPRPPPARTSPSSIASAAGAAAPCSRPGWSSLALGAGATSFEVEAFAIPQGQPGAGQTLVIEKAYPALHAGVQLGYAFGRVELALGAQLARVFADEDDTAVLETLSGEVDAFGAVWSLPITIGANLRL